MEYLTGFFPAFVLGAIFLTVIFTELLKKIDKIRVLKGNIIYLPAAFSLFFAGLLVVAEMIALKALPYYWMSVFGFSVFGYEAIVKKLKEVLHDKDES